MTGLASPRRPDTPLTAFLPFNIDCLNGEFVPAKDAGSAPSHEGHWLAVQNQGLVVADGEDLALHVGGQPDWLAGGSEPVWLGTWKGTACWAISVPGDAVLPAGVVFDDEAHDAVPRRPA